jgi:hypothetical protein
LTTPKTPTFFRIFNPRPNRTDQADGERWKASLAAFFLEMKLFAEMRNIPITFPQVGA